MKVGLFNNIIGKRFLTQKSENSECISLESQGTFCYKDIPYRGSIQYSLYY